MTGFWTVLPGRLWQVTLQISEAGGGLRFILSKSGFSGFQNGQDDTQSTTSFVVESLMGPYN